jgi:hypothetical protein
MLFRLSRKQAHAAALGAAFCKTRENSFSSFGPNRERVSSEIK